MPPKIPPIKPVGLKLPKALKIPLARKSRPNLPLKRVTAYASKPSASAAKLAKLLGKDKKVKEYGLAGELIEFCEMLRVPEGAQVGRRMVLREWQKVILRDAFNDPDLRRLIISFSRKQGKTALAAMLLLAALVGPLARLNSQIYSAAQSRDQAAIVFHLAVKMYQLTPELHGLLVIRDSKKEIYCPSTGVLYRALSADATTAYGFSPRLAIHDELGQVIGPSSGLYDAIETGAGAQDKPLSIIISTQAMGDADLLSTLIDDALTGRDPHTKCYLFTIPEDLDAYDPANWHLANPALGDFCNMDEFMALAERAQAMPAFEPKFLNLNCNRRVSADAGMLSPTVWKENARPPEEIAFQENEIHMGLDLSARQDLSAAVVTARDEKGDIHVRCKFWTPEKSLKEREHRDKAGYSMWVKQGFLTAVAGVSVDYRQIALWLIRFYNAYPTLTSIRFDRWRIDELKRELSRFGEDGEAINGLLVEHGQGFRDMAPAIDRVEELALQGKLRHGMQPVLTWNVSNCVVTTDPAGNRKLDKRKRTGRIDGAQALIMAISGFAGEYSSGSYLDEAEVVMA